MRYGSHIFVLALAAVLPWLSGCADNSEALYQGRSTTDWAHSMVDADEHQRLRAVRALSYLLNTDAAAYAPLKSALDDENALIRARAATGLLAADREPELAMSVLVDVMGSDNGKARMAAYAVFQDHREKAIDALIEGMIAEDEKIRTRSAEAIAIIAPSQKSVLMRAVGQLSDRDTTEVRDAVYVMIARLPKDSLGLLEEIEADMDKAGTQVFSMQARVAVKKGIDEVRRKAGVLPDANRESLSVRME